MFLGATFERLGSGVYLGLAWAGGTALEARLPLQRAGAHGRVSLM